MFIRRYIYIWVYLYINTVYTYILKNPIHVFNIWQTIFNTFQSVTRSKTITFQLNLLPGPVWLTELSELINTQLLLRCLFDKVRLHNIKPTLNRSRDDVELLINSRTNNHHLHKRPTPVKVKQRATYCSLLQHSQHTTQQSVDFYEVWPKP